MSRHIYNYTKITGYDWIKWRNHRYEHVRGNFILSYEYQSYWKKGNRIKLKRTKTICRSYERDLLVGDIDYYGWVCIALFKQITCVPLDKTKVEDI